MTVRPVLAAKLAVCLVASTVGVFSVFDYWNLRLQRNGAEALVLQSADRVTDIIRRSTRYQMLNNDRAALYETIRAIGSEPGIVRVRIFSKDGRIQFSTDPSEVNHLVDKSAEACYKCHNQAAPLTRLDRPDRARIFAAQVNGASQRVLGIIRPIDNEAACSNAACHAHPPQQRILGVIDAQLSLTSVDELLARQRQLLLRFGVAAALFMCVVSLVFVWWVLHRPIRDLTRGIHRVTEGDLAYRLPVRSRDEVGDLAESFNRMTEELASARSALTAHAESLEQKVERTQEVLMGSEKFTSLGKLAATVAHEVNNPLFGILTYAKLCRREVEKSTLPDASKTSLLDQLAVIERESRRCGDLMRNLLMYAREAPRRREPVQINEIVHRAVTLVRHQYEIQNIALTLDLAEGLPDVPCDAGQIQQVLLVLLVNAAEAMAQGGSVAVSTRQDHAGQVRLEVRDTGPGIPAELRARIFEPFFTTKDDQLRTGLGLAVARSILEQHDGHIEVASTPGAGATFTLELPIVSAPVPQPT